MTSLALAVVLGCAIGVAATDPWVLALAVFGFFAGIAYADIKMNAHYVDVAAESGAEERTSWIAYFDWLKDNGHDLDWTQLRQMVIKYGWDTAAWQRAVDEHEAGVVDQLDGETEGDMR